MTLSPFQQAASRQGKRFEDTVDTLLRIDGWQILARNWTQPTTGAEIDCVAIDRDGIEWWVECKGSWEGPESARGARRGDTAKKAVAIAWLLSTLPDSERRPYLLVTSHMPHLGTLSRRFLDTAVEYKLFTAIRCIDSTREAS